MKKKSELQLHPTWSKKKKLKSMLLLMDDDNRMENQTWLLKCVAKSHIK